MRIHHLDCGTMCPSALRLTRGFSSSQAPGHMVCHCLLIETEDGLVLVDTGLGTEAVRDPVGWLGRELMMLSSPKLDPDQTARAHVERLGFKASDVRHIVVTHLDIDHAGGLADFPDAQVHVFRREHEVAIAPRRFQDRQRYRAGMWAHGPKWVSHQVDGDRWFGFERVVVLPGREDIALIPLAGHTEGHCGVAVPTDTGWLLHAGDSYFHHQELAAGARSPWVLEAYQWFLQADAKARRQNQQRLQELASAHGEHVRIVCSHDPLELNRVS